MKVCEMKFRADKIQVTIECNPTRTRQDISVLAAIQALVLIDMVLQGLP